MKGRHRHNGWLTLALEQTGGIIAAAAALITALVITLIQPPPTHRPFAISSGGPANITIVAVRQSNAVKVGTSVHSTQAAWIVLTVRVSAAREPVTIGHAQLIDAEGNTYLASKRLGQSLIDGTRLLQPGITLEADLAFEVPGPLSGLTAEFAPTAHNPLGAVIRLPVTAPGPGDEQTDILQITVKP